MKYYAYINATKCSKLAQNGLAILHFRIFIHEFNRIYCLIILKALIIRLFLRMSSR
jgi:hypothetical protein